MFINAVGYVRRVKTPVNKDSIDSKSSKTLIAVPESNNDEDDIFTTTSHLLTAKNFLKFAKKIPKFLEVKKKKKKIEETKGSTLYHN